MDIRVRALAFSLGFASVLLAADPSDPLNLLDQREAETRSATGPAVFLSPSTRAVHSSTMDLAIQKGLRYLEGAQHDNGSFDRLQSARIPNVDSQMIIRDPLEDPILMSDGPDKDAAESDTEEIADTSLAAETMMLAVRSGRSPELSPKCLKAIDFLCSQVKKWEGDTIYIQKRTLDPLHDPHPLDDPKHYLAKDVRFYDSTVDTFFTLRFLSEACGRIDDPARKAHVQEALDILVDKITHCQDARGTWPDVADPAGSLPVHRNLSRFNKWPQVPSYDAHTPNLVTHCVALGAINIAARNGVKVPLSVRYKAEDYLRQALVANPLRAGTLEKDVRVLTVVAAESEVYETCRTLSQNAFAARASGQNISIDDLNVLRAHAKQAKDDLRSVISRLWDVGDVPLEGPGLDALPEAITGLKSMNDGEERLFLNHLSKILLARQGDDGSLPATPKGTLARDDCIFGTATELRLLMMAADAQSPPAQTTPE